MIEIEMSKKFNFKFAELSKSHPLTYSAKNKKEEKLQYLKSVANQTIRSTNIAKHVALGKRGGKRSTKRRSQIGSS